MLREAGARVVGIVRQPGQSGLEFPPDVCRWHDAGPNAGPLAGLCAALDACKTPLLAVLATDMPLIDAAWFKRLHRLCKPGCGAIAQQPDGRYEPLAAIYPCEALPEVAHRLLTGCRTLQTLADALIERGLLVSVPLPADEAWKMANWNTPAEAHLVH